MVKYKGDNPIEGKAEDTLGRDKSAASFAHQVETLDASKGAVVGVLGPWGSGKTSFINLAKLHLEKSNLKMLEFNPWMFSGTQQLVDTFFHEISAQLQLTDGLSDIASILAEYGEAFSGMNWLPMIGPLIEKGVGTTKFIAEMLERSKGGILDHKARVETALEQLDESIVIVIDDLDRLSTFEIRDIFKLVRLTANFPNVIYILAFDRERVEDALQEDNIPGRAFLEKIIQVVVDIPFIPESVLNAQIFSALDESLNDIDTKRELNQEHWPDIFFEIIRPHISNVRDIRRYALGVHGTVNNLGDQVALEDILGLEAIRIFLPDVHIQLQALVDTLTSTEHRSSEYESERHKKLITEFLDSNSANQQIIKNLITRLFPAAEKYIGRTHFGSSWESTWLKDRRVAHKDILSLYLERIGNASLAAYQESEILFNRMTDISEFNEMLQSINKERLQDVIENLCKHEDDITQDRVIPGVVSLLNIMQYVPERQGDMFSYGPKTTVGRVVYRLINSVGNPSRTKKLVSQILPQVDTLVGKLKLINIVGHREGAGHKLVSKKAAKAFESEWRDKVRQAKLNEILIEPSPLQVLYIVKKESLDTEPELNLSSSYKLTKVLLEDAYHETKSQTMGRRAVSLSPGLNWDILVEVYSGEEILDKRIKALRKRGISEIGDKLKLADQYAKGLKPDKFD